MGNRLSKVLAAAGIASRRGAETLIFEGHVSVNGKQVLVPQTLVDPVKDCIEVDGERIGSGEKKVYYVINKPPGYLCSNARTSTKHRLVIDLFPPHERLFTVGRLDKETTGLLIVTNDGHFANRVIHPSFNHTKDYIAKTRQEVTLDHLQALSHGALIEGRWIKPVAVKKVRRGTVKITVAEGKKHEVRELVSQGGLTLLSLARTRVGPLTLGELPLGQWRPLREKEISLF